MPRHARTLSVGEDNTRHLSAGLMATCFPAADLQCIIFENAEGQATLLAQQGFRTGSTGVLGLAAGPLPRAKNHGVSCNGPMSQS